MIESFDTPLAPLTTMRVGGPADRLVLAETTDDLVDVVREIDDADEPLLLISGGSNLVIADAGFRGTAVKVASRGITVESSDQCGGATVRVAAGEPWDEFVAYAIAQGWSGVEALSGIPGCVGSTPVQNVGAYGQEVADTIASVRLWDRREQRVTTLAAADCGFGYRESLIKRSGGRYVVLDVAFQFLLGGLSAPIRYADLAAGLGVTLGERVPVAAAREAVLEQRRRRGMVLDEDDHDTWSCGSFFTNPLVPQDDVPVIEDRVATRLGVDAAGSMPSWPATLPDGQPAIKLSAAWLIERAGFGKGFGMPGPAALSTRHTLAITNRGGATARDVVSLAATIRDGVRDAFGVTLVNEPVLVGESL
ncbi:MAG: UDP-N-acetylmuramate dehydrogenase [Dermatophilaceae bacterium]